MSRRCALQDHSGHLSFPPSTHFPSLLDCTLIENFQVLAPPTGSRCGMCIRSDQSEHWIPLVTVIGSRMGKRANQSQRDVKRVLLELLGRSHPPWLRGFKCEEVPRSGAD